MNEKTDCPSAEDLCAWFDGQLSSAVLDSHVNGCAQCKSIIKTYTRIDRQIRENVERPTQRDMGILVRIKDGSMKEISRSGRGSWLTPGFVAKIFLTCAVLAGLLGVIFMLPKSSGGGKGPDGRKLIEVPPTVQVTHQDDGTMMTLARKHAAEFEKVTVLALGTNPEILDPIVEKATPESLRADLLCTWSADEPSDALRFLKILLAQDYHRAFDEKILESSDYCTIVLALGSNDQREKLDGLLKAIGCKHTSDSSVTKTPNAVPTIRYSFIHSQ